MNLSLYLRPRPYEYSAFSIQEIAVAFSSLNTER